MVGPLVVKDRTQKLYQWVVLFNQRWKHIKICSFFVPRLILISLLSHCYILLSNFYSSILNYYNSLKNSTIICVTLRLNTLKASTSKIRHFWFGTYIQYIYIIQHIIWFGSRQDSWLCETSQKKKKNFGPFLKGQWESKVFLIFETPHQCPQDNRREWGWL